MNRKAFILHRILVSIPVLFGASILIFVIARVIPADPVRLALGKRATQEQVEALREELGLNEPLYVQYVDWLINVLQGDWGLSLMTRNNVFQDITTRLMATVELVLVAMLFALVVGVPFGVIAADNKDRIPDHVSRSIAFFGVSMPRFWLAIVLQILLVSHLGWFPLIRRLPRSMAPPPTVTGMYLVDSLIAGQLDTFLASAHHIALPAVALGTATLARISRYIRSDMIDVRNADFILMERSFGLPKKIILYKYMIKNAFSSTLTILGLSFAGLIGNAFLIEIVFTWPGIARYGVQAILFGDFNAIVGVTIVVAAVFILSNLTVDLLYGYLDPRIVLGEEG